MLKKTLPLLASISLLASATTAHANQPFTPEQEKAIGEIAAKYLTEHPDFLVEASQNLQQQQQQEKTKLQIAAIIKNQDQLLQDPSTPFTGPKDAKINIIEFFDYQCIFCYKISKTIEVIQEKNPDIRFIFKETPIFGNRWKPSQYAAQVGLWVFSQGQSKAYQAYHNAVYATGKNEGKLTNEDVNQAVQKAGLDINNFKATDDYQQNLQLFGTVGFQGTPGLIVMPSEGADETNTFVINGADEAALMLAIRKIKGASL